MGLITEVSSEDFVLDDDNGVEDTLEDKMRLLLAHFYTQTQLTSPKLLSLIKYVDDSDDVSVLSEYEWEKSPKNFVNCLQTTVALFEKVLADENLMTAHLSVLAPLCCKMMDSDNKKARICGLDLLLSLFKKNPIYFLERQLHMLALESAICSLTLGDTFLIAKSYKTMVKLIRMYVTEPDEETKMYDKLTERCLFCLSHSGDGGPSERIEHWKGLVMIMESMQFPFIRHLQYVFKTIELVSFEVNTRDEFESIVSFIRSCEVNRHLAKRIKLRDSQISRIIARMSENINHVI